jgi:hypothetical protein
VVVSCVPAACYLLGGRRPRSAGLAGAPALPPAVGRVKACWLASSGGDIQSSVTGVGGRVSWWFSEAPLRPVRAATAAAADAAGRRLSQST